MNHSSPRFPLVSALLVVLAAPALAAQNPPPPLGPAVALRSVNEAKGFSSPDPAAKACVTMTMSCNSTVMGILDATDCELVDGTRIDFWEFEGLDGQDVTINLTSDEFDTYLFLLDPASAAVAQDDDSGTGTNSLIVYSLDASGTWAIGANGFSPLDLGNYTLSLECSDPPATVVINEILPDPDQVADSVGEWFELFNDTAGPIDIDGWTIQDNDTDSHVITNGGPLLIPAGGFLVLARNGESATNGGITADYVYGGSITLANTSDELVLLDSTLTEVDRVEWDDGATFPDPTGASMELARDRLPNNHLGENWCEGLLPFGDGDLGTPGTTNNCFRGTYYGGVDLTSLVTTRQTVHDAIDDHIRTPYSSATSWLILETADEDPANSDNILDVYRNRTFPKVGGGGGGYEREHTWPQSYGFPTDSGTSTYPRSDYHGIFLADASYNGSRSNLPYDSCSACDEKPTDFNNGQGGTFTGIYPGDSNWRTGAGSTGSWETWTGTLGGRRGDVARAVLYMDVRYDGSDHLNGTPEPDLIATSNRALLNSDSDNPQDPAYMGILSTLLSWHDQDPPDLVERSHNEVIFAAQGNRNPFIDHPEWVRCVFIEACGIFANGFESGDTAAWTNTVP